MLRSRRTLVLAAALVAVLLVPMPAVGNGDSLVTRALELAKRAERKADRAQRTATRATRLAARKAKRGKRGPRGRQGPTGPAGAQGPPGAPGPQGPAGAAPSIVSDVESARVETTSASYVDLGGPSVDLTVPASGLVELYAQVSFDSPAGDIDDAGAVALFDGAALAPGQDPSCGDLGGPTTVPAALLSGTPATIAPGGDPTAPLRFGTGTTPNPMVGGCGTLGPPSPVLVRLSPGQHTLSLRYAYCGCATGPVGFSERQLYVTPRP